MEVSGEMRKENNVCIVTEGGKKSGFGHIARCVALYDAFEEKGFAPEFIVNGDKSISELLKGKRYHIINWIKEKDKLFTMSSNASIVVLDSYLAGKPLYDKISKITDGRIVMLDDCNRLKYPKGIVVNSAIDGDKMPYPKKDGITYLLGSKYVILRKEFWAVPKKKINKEVKNIVVTFGGKDYSGLINKTICHLRDNFHFDIDVVGAGNNKLNAREVLNLILKADVCISGGGQTLHECARVGLPTIAVCVADNQLNNILGWKRAGFIQYAGWITEEYIDKKIKNILYLLRKKEMRQEMSAKGRSLVDGNGTMRLVEEIIKIMKKSDTLLKDFEFGEADVFNFVNLSSKEKETVRKLRNHKTIRNVMYSHHIISKKEHRQFMQHLVSEKKDFYWLVRLKKGDAVGVISLQRIDWHNKNAYIGIYANPYSSLRQKGKMLMKCLKEIAFKKANLHTLKLEVITNNVKALSFYRKTGFRKEGSLKEFVLRSEQWHDVVIMGIINRG